MSFSTSSTSSPHTTNPTAKNRSPLPTPADKAIMNGTHTPMTPPASANVDSLFQPPPSTSTSHAQTQPSDPDHTTTDREVFEDATFIPRPLSAFVLGTRKSQLALTQTHLVCDALAALHPDYDFSVEWMTTVGDRNQQTPLHLLTPYSQQQPAKSLWTDELEARMMNGGFDLIVHSLKDVPTTLKDGCEIACMMEREDPRDALVVKQGLEYKSLADLPDGSVVGTGSVRRVAQLKRAYPKLKFEDMRGNLNTRLAKLDAPTSPFAALILAISGLSRINSGHRVTSPISSPDLYHAVGQGALGVEIRSGDPRVRETMRGIGHWQTEWRCGAERGCLRVLEGGCSVPVGIESILEELPADDVNQQDDIFAEETFDRLTNESPMLWFSGIVDSTHSLPVSRVSTPSIASASISSPLLVRTLSTLTTKLPPLRPRRARLTVRACVTSLDGAQQVIHAPPAVIVRNYQEAERWGEIIARQIKVAGGKAILDEVTAIRRERERKDLERAFQKSMQDAEGGDGTRTPGREEHQGLQVLMKTLMGESKRAPEPGAHT